MTNEEVADIHEALELMKEYAPIYMAVLKSTGDKEQAKDVVVWLRGLYEQV